MHIKERIRNEIVHRKSKKMENLLKKEDLDLICSYLENPTKTGLWSLKFTWLKKEGISKEIKEELEKIGESVEVGSGKKKRKIKLKQEDKEELIRKAEKLSFIFNLFTHLYLLEKEEDFDYYREISDSEERLILDLIDLDEITEKYKEAFEYFKEHIYIEGFDTRVYTNEILLAKEGFFIYTKDSEKRYEEYEDNLEKKEIYLVSLKPEILEILKKFYEKLGKISEASLMPIYSPEEDVFDPYFVFLGEVYEEFIDNDNIRRLFRKSISEYKDGNFTSCINTIGLIAEDYLVQIYETLFREICPKGLTLGQIYDLIQNTIRKQFQKETLSEPNIQTLFKSTKELLNINKTASNKEILIQIMHILKYLNEDKKYRNAIDQTKRKNGPHISIFNEQLQENVYELIKNRNATSHRTRIPIGDYEALRTVYCCITLILWWINKKKEINWKKSSRDIIEDLIKN